LCRVKRLAVMLVLLAIGLLGSGAMEYEHNLEHAAEDRAEAQWLREHHLPTNDIPIHDESNCDVHGQLHLALYFMQWVPLLVLLGLFIAFLSQLPTPLIRQHVPVRLDCRGPPANRASF
jgi:hypothetical protein